MCGEALPAILRQAQHDSPFITLSVIQSYIDNQMDTNLYLNIFQNSLNRIHKQDFSQKQLELKVGVWLDSVVLKIQKPAWINHAITTTPFKESIFFSIWLNDASIKESKLLYNIHALKLRQLPGYKIQSREFAEAFRLRFKAYQDQWPNVSMAYGPLTLMEGYVNIDAGHFEHVIIELAYKFLEIEFIIDELLAERKK